MFNFLIYLLNTASVPNLALDYLNSTLNKIYETLVPFELVFHWAMTD